MKRLALAIALVLGAAAAPQAAPLDPKLQRDLLAVYDTYAKAIAAGKVDAALATRTAAAKKRLQAALKNRRQRAELLEFAKQLNFERVEVVHAALAKSGSAATLMAIGTIRIPADAKMPPGAPAPGSTVRMELTLDFAREGGQWRFDEQTLGGDPDRVQKCPSETFEPAGAYDRDRNVSLGGPVRRVAFEADHTLVVVRVLDEEHCAFLPPRAALGKSGFNPAQLVPYAIVSIQGSPHKTDSHKVWGAEISVSDE